MNSQASQARVFFAVSFAAYPKVYEKNDLQRSIAVTAYATTDGVFCFWYMVF